MFSCKFWYIFEEFFFLENTSGGFSASRKEKYMKCDRSSFMTRGLSKVTMLRTKTRAIFLKNSSKKKNKLQRANEYNSNQAPVKRLI